MIFLGITVTLSEALGAAGGGVGGPGPNLLVVNSSCSSSSRKSRLNPQLMVEGSLSFSLMSGRLAAKSI